MWRRLVSLYMSATGRRRWQAVSPSGSIQLGFMTDSRALETGHKLGKVSFFDLEHAVIIYDVQLSQNQHGDISR